MEKNLPPPKSDASAESPRPLKLRKYSPYYNLIACSPELSDGAKTLYQYLRFLWDENARLKNGQRGPRLNPGYRDISEKLGCKMDSIKGWLDQLVESGWLTVEAGKRHANINKRYTLLNGFGQVLPNRGAFTVPLKGSSRRRSPKQERNRSQNGEPMVPSPKERGNKRKDGASLGPDFPSESGRGAVMNDKEALRQFINEQT